MAQVKQRLQTRGLYIADTKPGGFSLEVAHTDSNTMKVGVRVMLGSKDMTRVPANMELFGRTVNVTLVRPRWVEFCFTWEESFQCQNKVSINFAALLKHASQVLMMPSLMDVEQFDHLVATSRNIAVARPEEEEQCKALQDMIV